jgi:hypothetical protein
MAENTILDMDALLDATLDNVADIPDFLNPPDGLYELAITEAEIKPGKEAGKASRIVLTHKVVSTVDTDGVPVPNGSLFQESFQGTEQGLGFFKKQAKKYMNVDDISGVSMREIIASLKGLEYKARVTTKVTKNDAGKEYENVNVRPIWEA